MALAVGQLAGDFEVLGVLGKGGMGQVYRVRNVISNRIEAMKVLLADVAADPELSERFLGEIRTLARLDHPNIAKLHSAFKVDNQLVMVMEFIEGVTLFERANAGRIPLEDALSYASQMLAALGYAHAQGVIHRDIKPSNIMVTDGGTAKLMDFGIAKSSTDPLHTRTGITIGSMLYMSPEQARGMPVDARSDLYSLGVLLYELAAGRRPFQGENTYAILEAQLNAVPNAPSEVNPNIPKPLSDIIMTALAKEPERRFQSANAFRNAIESVRVRPAGTQAETVAAEHPAQAAPGSPVLATQSNWETNRGVWMLLGAIACVIVLIAAAAALPHMWRSSAASKASNPATQSSSVIPQRATEAPDPNSPPQKSKALHTDVRGLANPTQSKAPLTDVRGSVDSMHSEPQRTQTAPALPAATPIPAATPPSGPSPEEIETVHQSLVQLHARADAVRSSIAQLREQEAASGVGLRQDIAASASRLDMYLQAADQAAESNNLESAHKNMEHVEEELSKLEAFLGK